jgi:ribosomal protein S18 acetylase RimI-like enzyme
MIAIRRMREADADAVREVDAVAFWTWEKQVKGEAARLVRRTRINILACREKDPGGCFVAEDEGQVVGFIFSRTWGGVGWFGTFAVLPEYQGQGIGQRLMAASLEYLHRGPDRVIGLETMPGSPYNLGLYLRQGFQARLPTLLLRKPPEPHTTDEARLRCWSAADNGTRKRWLADLREATGQILPGLDYSKEIVSNTRHSLGETLVLTEGTRAVGVSVVKLVSDCENPRDNRVTVRTLALHPGYTKDETLRALLDATEAIARNHGKQTPFQKRHSDGAQTPYQRRHSDGAQDLKMAVNARHTWAVERLLQWGYEVERMAVHMVLQETDSGPSIDDKVDFSRWAG